MNTKTFSCTSLHEWFSPMQCKQFDFLQMIEMKPLAPCCNAKISNCMLVSQCSHLMAAKGLVLFFHFISETVPTYCVPLKFLVIHKIDGQFWNTILRELSRSPRPPSIIFKASCSSDTRNFLIWIEFHRSSTSNHFSKCLNFIPDMQTKFPAPDLIKLFQPLS